MATVVNVPKDPRFESLGVGVGQFLNRMAETRRDKLQQDLFREISRAEDEASAAALLADPRYQDVVNDPKRFALIDQHLANAQPGQETLFGYDDQGNQVPFSIRKGTPVNSETFSSRGLHVTPEVPFYVADPTDPEGLPVNLGLFRNRGDATAKAKELFGEESEQRILSLAEAETEAQFATQRSQNRRAETELLLSQERFDFQKRAGLTPFANLVHEYTSGNLSLSQFEEAWRTLNFRAGLTPSDVAEKTIEDLKTREGKIEAASQTANNIAQAVISDPRLISRTAGVVRFGADLQAEIDSLVLSFGGRPNKTVDDYEWGTLAAESTSMKNMLLDLAIISAGIRGQEGRNLSDRDLKIFLTRVGTDIHNPVAFVTNLRDMVGGWHRDYRIEYARLQGAEYGGTFTSIHLDANKEREAYEERLRKDWDLELPSNKPAGD